MGSFLLFISGFCVGVMIGFPFAPTFKTPREENLGLDRSDRMLRIGGGVLYTILLLVFFFLVLFKN